MTVLAQYAKELLSDYDKIAQALQNGLCSPICSYGDKLIFLNGPS